MTLKPCRFQLVYGFIINIVASSAVDTRRSRSRCRHRCCRCCSWWRRRFQFHSNIGQRRRLGIELDFVSSGRRKRTRQKRTRQKRTRRKRTRRKRTRRKRKGRMLGFDLHFEGGWGGGGFEFEDGGCHQRRSDRRRAQSQDEGGGIARFALGGRRVGCVHQRRYAHHRSAHPQTRVTKSSKSIINFIWKLNRNVSKN